MRFEAAALDSYAQRITAGVAYLGGLLVLPLLFAYLANLRWGGLLIPIALALALALFLLLAFLFQPTAYVIDGRELVIVRRWPRRFKLPLEQITAASAAATLVDVPRRGLRFAFNPGLFGYLGPFHLAPYGTVFFLATNRARLVALARDGRVPLIISPARPRDFIAALNEQRAAIADAKMRAEAGEVV